jgi:hypothetical protein
LGIAEDPYGVERSTTLEAKDLTVNNLLLLPLLRRREIVHWLIDPIAC